MSFFVCVCLAPLISQVSRTRRSALLLHRATAACPATHAPRLSSDLLLSAQQILLERHPATETDTGTGTGTGTHTYHRRRHSAVQTSAVNNHSVHTLSPIPCLSLYDSVSVSYVVYTGLPHSRTNARTASTDARTRTYVHTHARTHTHARKHSHVCTQHARTHTCTH